MSKEREPETTNPETSAGTDDCVHTTANDAGVLGGETDLARQELADELKSIRALGENLHG